MKSCLRFFINAPKDYAPRTHGSQPLVTALQRSKHVFLTAYEFLSVGLSADCIPGFQYAAGQLPHLWVNAIPFEFGIGVMRNITEHKFSSLKDFFSAFFAVTEKILTAEEDMRARDLVFDSRKPFVAPWCSPPPPQPPVPRLRQPRARRFTPYPPCPPLGLADMVPT